ncbi:MAG: hypothetical protein IPJ40_24340 [Saprospirales bacterium]|nr:hypothetical protein [Saprospirales bacterium]
MVFYVEASSAFRKIEKQSLYIKKEPSGTVYRIGSARQLFEFGSFLSLYCKEFVFDFRRSDFDNPEKLFLNRSRLHFNRYISTFNWEKEGKLNLGSVSFISNVSDQSRKYFQLDVPFKQYYPSQNHYIISQKLERIFDQGRWHTKVWIELGLFQLRRLLFGRWDHPARCPGTMLYEIRGRIHHCGYFIFHCDETLAYLFKVWGLLVHCEVFWEKFDPKTKWEQTIDNVLFSETPVDSEIRQRIELFWYFNGVDIYHKYFGSINYSFFRN